MAHRRDSTPTSDGLGTKRKRLPACDCCKMRRLKCDPVPPPASCSRCKTTGVVCTTTPVVRKKAVPRSGKRIEEAKCVPPSLPRSSSSSPDKLTLAAPAGRPSARQTPTRPTSWASRARPGCSLASRASPRRSRRACASRPCRSTTSTPGSPRKSSTARSSLTFSSVRPSLSLSPPVRQRVELTSSCAALAVYQTFPQSWLPISARGRIAHQFEAVGRRLDALPPQAEVRRPFLLPCAPPQS